MARRTLPPAVPPDVIGSLPGWVVAGVLVGALMAVAAAAVFAVGVRILPDGNGAAGGREGGERRRRAEIRRYLADIGEPYREDHPVGGLTAAFYLPERGVAITFDARDYFRLDRAGVRAVLLEYELPGARLGDRLPFETPEPEPGPEASADAGGSARRGRPPGSADQAAARDSAFAALGLDPGASEAAVRAAYRQRVKDAHPDHGGDAESFRQLREAYTVARDGAG